MRKLASVQKILNVENHFNADLLDIVQIKGWKCVVGRDTFKENDLGIYFEIDSFIPITKKFIEHKNTIVFDNIEGTRIRTMKLRGEVSQGLIVPISSFDELSNLELKEDDDVTNLLGILKYEKPLDLVQGDILGYMPGIIKKTDQERIQNMMDIDLTGEWEETEKLEGTSCTMYILDGHFGVCGRNLEYNRSIDDSFWKEAIRLNLEERLSKLNMNLAIQGEFIGPKIQKNIYDLKIHEFRVFDIQNLDERRNLDSNERKLIIDELNKNSDLKILEVPFLGIVKLEGFGKDNVETLLEKADGKSLLNSNVWREGVVYKKLGSQLSFKVISNKYLLKEK